MYGVTSGFISALRSGSIVSDVLVQTSDGSTLTIDEGSVTMDSRRGITRTCELTITADTRSAQQLFSLMLTPGLEVSVYRGILVNGAFEYVALGVFSTDTAEVEKTASGSVKWSGSDRSKKISRNRFTDPYVIAASTDLATAAGDLIADRLPGANYDFSNVYATVTAQVIFEGGESSDPWQALRDLMADYGYDVNFDGTGTCRAIVVPDPANVTPVFDFGSGDTQLILGGQQRGSLESVYNGVIASGEGTGVGTPVRVEVWDTDPTSPTYFESGFGKVPYFYSSPLLTTLDLCATAAVTLLSRIKGRFTQLSWPAIVNPALEPLDVVTVNYDDGTSNVVLDSLTIPLRPNASMSAVAREVALNQ